MNTQTHVLLAAALLSKPGSPARNTAVIAGALVPDLAIYTLFVWSKLAGIPERRVWNELYYNPPWSNAVTVGNSAPLYLDLLITGVLIARRWRAGLLLALFAGAALIHIATDLPVHVDDAHAHLWPLSDWLFRSAGLLLEPGTQRRRPFVAGDGTRPSVDRGPVATLPFLLVARPADHRGFCLSPSAGLFRFDCRSFRI